MLQRLRHSLSSPPAELIGLLDRYAETFDAGDAAGWVECFEPGGEFTSITGVTHRQRAQLLVFASELQARWRKEGIHSRHEWSDLRVIEYVSDATRDIWRCVSHGEVWFVRADRPPELALRNVYTDVIVRTETGARFVYRTATARPTSNTT
jgi:hypothetical protein